MRAFVLSALLVSGCNQQSYNQKADNRICLLSRTWAQGEMVNCVHDWAFRLAQSPDPAEVVAKAVTRACVNLIDQDAQRTAVKVAGHPDEARRQAFFKISMEVMEGQALFRVIQARAGHCEIPYGN